MRKVFLHVAFFWCALVTIAGAGTIVQNFDDVTYWVGSGENRAVLIIDWQDNKNAPGETAGEALAWGFQWPVGQTRTGREMIEAIAAADPRLELMLDFRSFGSIVFGLGYDRDGDGGVFTFDPENEEGSASDPNDHFGEGWRNAFWGYKVNDPSKPSGTLPAWIDAEVGFESRTLANNSWDAWVISHDLIEFSIPDPSPALAAVPEPSTVALLLFGPLLLVRRRSRL